MISEGAMLPDHLKDSAGLILLPMRNEGGWTTTKSRMRNELVEQLIKDKYIAFEGSPYRYHITKVGESYLYDVPLYKQGFLKRFRGKRIRIVCIGSGRYTRTYMAGVVGITPKELIIEKLTHTYTFPDYATKSEAIYKTRRFLLCKADKQLKIICDKEPKGYIELDEWDSILIDGRKGIPIAKARQNSDGTVDIRQMGWLGQHKSSNYTQAVKYITKYMTRLA